MNPKFRSFSVLSLCMVTSLSCIPCAGAVDLPHQIVNSSSLSDAQAAAIWEEARADLLAIHDGTYSLENFCVEFLDAASGGVDLNITADRTLLIHPDEDTYFDGMQDALDTISGDARAEVEAIYTAQYEDALASYGRPVEVSYSLHAETSDARTSDFRLLAR